VNPDADLAQIARDESWQVMQFERIGRRLAIAGATVVAALAGLGGHRVAVRRAAQSSRRPRLRAS